MNRTLMIALCVFGFLYYKATIDKLTVAQVVENALKPGELQKVVVGDGGVTNIVKDPKSGKDVKTTKYIPSEGNVKIVYKEDPKLREQYEKMILASKELQDKLDTLESSTLSAEQIQELDMIKQRMDELTKEKEELVVKLSQADVEVQDMGFTLRPGFGLAYSGKFFPSLDAKFFYLQRYSAVVGINENGLFLSGTRHIDDVLYFMKNLELAIMLGVDWRLAFTPGLYLRSNF